MLWPEYVPDTFVVAGSIFDVEGTIERDRLSGHGRREGFAEHDDSHRDWLRAR
jgi:hypothetical protein